MLDRHRCLWIKNQKENTLHAHVLSNYHWLSHEHGSGV